MPVSLEQAKKKQDPNIGSCQSSHLEHHKTALDKGGNNKLYNLPRRVK